MKVRHYHQVEHYIDRNNQLATRRTRLVASVASLRCNNGVVCVGVARCHPNEYEGGKSVKIRKQGNKLAQERARNQFLFESGVLENTLSPTEVERHFMLQEKKMALTMTEEEYQELFERNNPFDGRGYDLDRTHYTMQ